MNEICFLLHLHDGWNIVKVVLVAICHIHNKNAKTEYYALTIGLQLDIVHVILWTKFQDNPLRNGCDIAVRVRGILD